MERRGGPSDSSAAAEDRIVVCIPVLDDWPSLVRLLAELDAELAEQTRPVDVVVVDDGSRTAWPADLATRRRHLRAVEVVRLRRNLGHQRAIAVGLSFIYCERPCRAVLVMDGDGQDTAAGAAELIRRFEASNGEQAIFAARARRMEGVLFRLGYLAFKALHRVLTGRRVRVGNFSILPFRHLDSLVVTSELWNHYAAAVYKSRLAATSVPIARAERYAGASSMNVVSLVVHGLSAISVFSEEVGVRLLVAGSSIMLLASLGVGTVFGIRLLTDLAIPGWATYATGLLGVALLQSVLLVVVFVFVTLRARDQSNFVPLRDFRFFVSDVREVSPGRGQGRPAADPANGTAGSSDPS